MMSSEEILASLERHFGILRSQWAVNDWKKAANILAATLDNQTEIAQLKDELSSLISYARSDKTSARRRGRPRKPRGLEIAKKRRGRHPDKNRLERSVAVCVAVEQRITILQERGIRPTNKAALEDLLAGIAKHQDADMPQWRIRRFINANYHRYTKLLSEGKNSCRKWLDKSAIFLPPFLTSTRY